MIRPRTFLIFMMTIVGLALLIPSAILVFNGDVGPENHKLIGQMLFGVVLVLCFISAWGIAADTVIPHKANQDQDGETQ